MRSDPISPPNHVAYDGRRNDVKLGKCLGLAAGQNPTHVSDNVQSWRHICEHLTGTLLIRCLTVMLTILVQNFGSAIPLF